MTFEKTIKGQRKLRGLLSSLRTRKGVSKFGELNDDGTKLRLIKWGTRD